MKKILKMIVCCFLSVNSIHLLASEGIELGVPVYGGSGCPAGSAFIALDSAEGGVTMHFDKYEAVADKVSKTARVSCNMAIPLHIPQGYAVSVIAVDYIAYVSLPKKAQARFSAEYFFTGTRGARFDKIITGAIEDLFKIENGVVLESQVWSRCGEDTILRINSSILVQTTKKQAVAMIDSASLNPAVIYRIQSKRCQ